MALAACGAAGAGDAGSGTEALPVGQGAPSVAQGASTAPAVSFGTGSGATTPAVPGAVEKSGTKQRPDSLPVRPESMTSPLPEVVVRHLQEHTWVQLKNVLPADLPVLVWFWAPH